MNCKYCNGNCIKKGFNASKQKYQCKVCKRFQQKAYSYRMCNLGDNETIIKLNNIGVGISGIAKFTGISKANVINRISAIAAQLKMPAINENKQHYEMDELQTFVKNKQNRIYLIYALNKKTKQIIDFLVGSRTKENISKVVSVVTGLNPARVFTDKLNIYPSVLNEAIHKPSSYKINHIERFNLTLRTHIKRLTRRSICFSKSAFMLQNVLKIYFCHL